MDINELVDWVADRLRGMITASHYNNLPDEEFYKRIREILSHPDLFMKTKCPHCEWSQFQDETVGMAPCYHCNSSGYIVIPLAETIKEEKDV